MKGKGKISVIHGPMFSGKTEELLRRLRRAKIAKKNVQLFKPKKDDRYAINKVLPHYLANYTESPEVGEEAISVSSPNEIYTKLLPTVDLIGIEEAQFFDYSLFYILKKIANQGIDIVVSLLDQDFRRMPFPIENSDKNVGDYIAIAHDSLKLTAICVKCGEDAYYSQKLIFVKEYPSGKPVYVPASFHSEIVVVGTSKENTKTEKSKYPLEIYEARCHNCHELPDEPDRTAQTEDSP